MNVVASLSTRNVCAYVQACAGNGESTTDGVYGGRLSVYENGKLLAERPAFSDADAKGNFFADLAYKYSQTDGEYFPFMSYYSDDELNNVCDVTNVSDKRHQVLLTLGYKF